MSDEPLLDQVGFRKEEVEDGSEIAVELGPEAEVEESATPVLEDETAPEELMTGEVEVELDEGLVIDTPGPVEEELEAALEHDVACT
jgi:hypothetical protein